MNDAWPRLDEVHGPAHGSWKISRNGVNFVMLRHRFVKDTESDTNPGPTAESSLLEMITSFVSAVGGQG